MPTIWGSRFATPQRLPKNVNDHLGSQPYRLASCTMTSDANSIGTNLAKIIDDEGFARTALSMPDSCPTTYDSVGHSNIQNSAPYRRNPREGSVQSPCCVRRSRVPGLSTPAESSNSTGGNRTSFITALSTTSKSCGCGAHGCRSSCKGPSDSL